MLANGKKKNKQDLFINGEETNPQRLPKKEEIEIRIFRIIHKQSHP
jgi:hypothetical protein